MDERDAIDLLTVLSPYWRYGDRERQTNHELPPSHSISSSARASMPKRLDVVLVTGQASMQVRRESAAQNVTNPRDFRLCLCRGGERPPDRYAAEKCDELTPPHATPPIYADAKISDGEPQR
jgi:hypothetical protein